MAVALKCGMFESFIKSLNNKNMKVLSNVVLNGKPKDAGKKRKATQIRKGPANKKAPKINLLVEPQSIGGMAPSAPSTPPSVPVQPTVPQYISSPMYLPQFPPYVNLQPKTPDPQPGQYHLTLLKFCHANTSTCYGCIGKFNQENVPPLLPPNDMVIVSKARRTYFDSASKVCVIAPNFSRVYFHFNECCIRLKDALFTPMSVFVPEDLKPFLTIDHVNMIRSSGIFF